ncbi:MAG TPA: ABC transporter permease [Gemmatimonadaceae bacterium]|nr:ABC transporter permease [Gemmatimonadaceae bacterium]
MLERWWRDVRHAVRGLRRNPLFTLVAVLSLAVGLGATTAIATLANALLLKPPPGVGAPERVVDLGRTQEGRGFDTFSYPNYLDVRERVRTLSGVAALRPEPQVASLATPGGVVPVQAATVSANYFAVLQARPAMGRFFVAEEGRAPGSAPVVVVSHRFWTERLAGDRAAVGKAIRLNGTPFTVVGVAAEGFHGTNLTAPDLWVPLTASTYLGLPASLFTSRASVWLMGVARLAPGVTLEAAQADVGGVAFQLERAYPRANEGKGLRLAPSGLFPGELRGAVQGFLGLLFAAGALVMLIAATNVAGMLLARAAARQREIAVRLAVGASRAQLVRQLLTESVLLFIVAALAGAAMSRWFVALLLGLLPRLPFAVAFDTALDLRVFAFAAAVALATGVLAGLAPALQATRPALVPALKREGEGGARRLRLRGGLVVAQLALSLLLLVGAGLFLRALLHARSIDPGFDARQVELAAFDLGQRNLPVPQARQLAGELVARAATLPGVQGAALAVDLPLDGGNFGLGDIRVPGRTPPPGQDSFDADWNVVTPGYLELLRIPLLAGRDFTAADREGAPDVAIINETLARTLWPGQQAVGRTFVNDDRVVTVVGVTRDAKYRSLAQEPRGFVYVPFAQRYFPRVILVTRGAPDAPSPAPAVRRMVADLDAALPIVDQLTLEERTAMVTFPQRVALYVAGSLGVVALLLAVLGIYGVTAYSVARRTRELGIRVALGATRGGVLRLVLREGALLAGVGALIGLAAAAALTRLLAGLLYGVPPLDPLAFGGAAVLLALAALAAAYLPARRAAAVDPTIALRSE